MAATPRFYGPSLIGILSLMGIVMLTNETARGQVLQSGTADQSTVDLSTPAMKYFGRSMHTPVARPHARRPALPTRRFQLAGGKPFQNLVKEPSLTPYLQLDALESGVGVPNYYSRVLPQIRQQQAIRAQADELRRLQQQVRLSNASGAIANNRNGGVPTTGHSSQFLNVGGFFPAASR